MNLNFFYKPKKKPKVTLDSDLLLSEDKRKIQELASEKKKHLESVEELNYKIMKVQDATNTLIPKFVRLHHNLRKKYRWYYNWHNKPYSSIAHWVVLIFYLMSLPLVYFALSPQFPRSRATTYDFPRWEWVNPAPTGNDLNKVTTCPNGSFWAVGDYGTILKSADGQTWNNKNEYQYSGTRENLNDIICFSDSSLIAVGDNSTILQYDPSIPSWTARAISGSYSLNELILDNNKLFTHAGGTIFISTDNGTSWAEKASGAPNILTMAINGNNIVLGGNNQTVWMSSNLGDTWEDKSSQIDPTVGNINKIISLNSQTFLGVSSNGYDVLSTDNGANWTTKLVKAGTNLTSLSKIDDQHAITYFGYIYTLSTDSWATNTSVATNFVSLGSNKIVGVNTETGGSYSTDSGQSWNTTAVLIGLRSITGSGLIVVAVGDDGAINYSGNAGQTWTDKRSQFSRTPIRVGQLSNNNLIMPVSAPAPPDFYGMISSNSGEDWTETSKNLRDFNILTSLSSNNALSGTRNQATAYYTQDGGVIWTTLSKATTTSSILRFDNSNAVFVESGKVLTYNISNNTWSDTLKTAAALKSYNNGLILDSGKVIAYGGGAVAGGYISVSDSILTSWTDQTIGTNDLFFGASSGANVVLAGNSGAIVVSNDSGTTWDAKTCTDNACATFAFQKVLKVDSTGDLDFVAIANGGKIAVTHDGGVTWTAKTSGVTTNLVDAISWSDKIIAVGASGAAIQSIDKGNTWSNVPVGSTADSFTSIVLASESPLNIIMASGTNVYRYHSPANATATKFSVQLPEQSFISGSGISGTPDSVKAGESVITTIRAVDGSNVLDKGNASTAGFTTTDPNDSNPAPVQLTQGGTCVQTNRQPGDPECGIGTASFTFHTPGTWTITASDTGGVLSSGTSSSITVTVGDPAKLVFSGFPSTLTAGAPSSAITINLQDTYGNQTTSGSSKTIRLSTTGSQGKFAQSSGGPWTIGQKDITLPAGVSTVTFNYLDYDTGTRTITATETPSAGWTDATGSLTLSTGQLSGSTLTVDKNSIGAGEEVTATVTLKNSESIALADRTVQLSSSRDSETITSTPQITNSSGVATFTVKSTQIGQFVLSAYDQTDGAYVPQDQTVTVGAGDLGRITLESSTSTPNSGSSLNLTTTLYDSYGNLATGYTGEISYSSSDSEAAFEYAKYSFSSSDSAKFTQSVILKNEGEQSITAFSEGGSIRTTIYVEVGAALITPTPTPASRTSVTLSPSATPSETSTPDSLIETFQESPLAKKIAKTLAPLAATVATLGLLPLLVQAFPQGFHLLASLFPALFTAFTARRRRKPWGIVYNTLSGKPVDLAVVRVFNAETDRLVGTKVTDQNGRFNFILPKGRYYVRVAKPGFIFPPKISKLKVQQLSTRFGPQNDIYFGQPFAIGTDDTNINLNVALDPKLSSLSLGVKLTLFIKNAFDWFLIALSYVAIPLMFLGATFATFATIVIPSRFNFYMDGFYVLLLIAFLVTGKIHRTRLGFVFDSKTKEPIKNAVISIFDKEYNAIKEIKAADRNGHFVILAQKGEYYLTVGAPGYKFPAKEFRVKPGDRKFGRLYFGEVIKNKKADFVNVSIPMDKK